MSKDKIKPTVPKDVLWRERRGFRNVAIVASILLMAICILTIFLGDILPAKKALDIIGNIAGVVAGTFPFLLVVYLLGEFSHEEKAQEPQVRQKKEKKERVHPEDAHDYHDDMI